MRWAAIAFIGLVVFTTAMYLRDIDHAYARVRQQGKVIASPYGDIEYTENGAGPPVLVIHGSGGGYDQGELIAQAVLDANFRAITPSRFGYLRSTFKEGAGWDEQANAYAYLLDHLGIERVALVAMSHGGPSALVFAILHPERVSSLILISCGVAPVSTPEQAEANRKGELLTTIFKHDFVYWAGNKLFNKQLMALIGASDTVIDTLSTPQRNLIERFLDDMNPVSLRSAGATFDNKTPLPGKRIAAITAPTLIFHATDDTLQLYENAKFAAATIPDAKLMTFDKGGHIVIAVEQSTIRAAVQSYILSHAQ